jgi:hypothetical protein
LGSCRVPAVLLSGQHVAKRFLFLIRHVHLIPLIVLLILQPANKTTGYRNIINKGNGTKRNG